MGIFTSIKYALKLAESNFGRDFGWIVEWNGLTVAELEDSRHDDMFWYSYRVVCKSEDDQAIVNDPSQWNQNDFVFINRVTNERVDDVFAGQAPYFISDGRGYTQGVHPELLFLSKGCSRNVALNAGWLISFSSFTNQDCDDYRYQIFLICFCGRTRMGVSIQFMANI